KKYFDEYPEETILIYSMWSGYRSLPGVKKLLDIAKNHETIHVSGHITKEDLEKVIGMVKPEKLMIHHISDAEKENTELNLPTDIKLMNILDGEFVEL
ncbi:hypothetical protein SAMN04487771_11061, partial [[Clostridium] aminophilum]